MGEDGERMSYCRWSDGDAYAYESESGFELHFATRRRVWLTGAHKLPSMRLPEAEFMRAYREYHDALDDANEGRLWNWENVQEGWAGESFTLDSAGELLEKLEEARAAGLDIPQYAIDAVREEAEDMGETK